METMTYPCMTPGAAIEGSALADDKVATMETYATIEWKRFFEKNGARLLLFARQQTRSAADAEDVFQEAFLKVWNSLSKGEEVPLYYFFRAIRQCAIDRARGEDRRGMREEKVAREAETVVWFERDLEHNERRARLENAVRQLPPEQQEVVVLRAWGEQGFREIGELLGISINTAASRYRYGLQRLREILAESGAVERAL